MATKKDILAELDLPGLLEKRAEAAEKQKETVKAVNAARAAHFLFFWIGGGAMAMAGAVVMTQVLPQNERAGLLLLAACIVFWIGMWVAAFFPTQSVRRRQSEAAAAIRHLKEMDEKIAFCHRVLEEAKNAKVRKYAEVWVEKELS